jgi:hypothetical protein
VWITSGIQAGSTGQELAERRLPSEQQIGPLRLVLERALEPDLV